MSTASRLLITDATIVSVDPGIGVVPVGDIAVEDGVITAVGPGQPREGAIVIDGSAWIVAPGFVDTHRHTWLSAIRHSYGDVDPLRYFKEVLGGAGPRYSPEDVYAATRLGAVSALSSGTTTLMDWAHIQNTPDHADAGLAALTESGIRSIYGHGWPMTTDGAWTSSSELRHPDDIWRLADIIDGQERTSLALAARGPEMAVADVWEHELRLARELGIRTSVHVGAYAPNARARAVEAYAQRGLLSDDMTFVHCSNTSDEEIAMLAEAGATVSLGVHCELNSQGIGDVPLDRLLAHGVRPSLSGDNETKCAGDMFTQMRSLFAYYRSWVGGRHSSIADPHPLTLQDMLEFATIEGARAVGLQDSIGSITPGKQADLICLRHDDLNIAPVTDPVAAIVLGAHEGNIDTVFVAGEQLKSGGRMIRADSAETVRLALEAQQRLYPEWDLRP
ncbi:amidohydrolase family protein [Microbacterium pseudoresistens]|uniref:Cytosine/adenosine deaminase-related metal-dependent hydrolase n=1 Tax=Microbacterium pseudoresistens TaxID=640634 RepID=A0A7Y9JM03_9MICO|nr:amidohydrolase family protein [Microbacterium pseudoresistens]NYD53875.1 cytosine/adenosine deaminase-related metal-dependent hydrolase [Microbacterium pseudoresistens]